MVHHVVHCIGLALETLCLCAMVWLHPSISLHVGQCMICLCLCFAVGYRLLAVCSHHKDRFSAKFSGELEYISCVSYMMKQCETCQV